MAEQVQFHLERMLPDLEELQERGIFTRNEVKAIVKRRTAFEYAVHRAMKKKTDYLRYIEFELNLESLRKRRQERLAMAARKGLVKSVMRKGKNDVQRRGGDDKVAVHSSSDGSIVKRINGLYSKALRKFPGDVDLWLQFFAWAETCKNMKTTSRFLIKAIQSHPRKPVFWIKAAKIEFERNNNMNAARTLLIRALRINKDSAKIYLEYFKLELLYVDRLLERRKILFKEQETKRAAEKASEETEDVPAPVEVPNLPGEAGSSRMEQDPEIQASLKQSTSGNAASEKKLTDLVLPRVVYKNAIKAIPDDLDFRLKFLAFYTEFGYDSDNTAVQEFYGSLTRDFPSTPRAIGVLAQRHLPSEVSDPIYPSAVKITVSDFEAAVARVGTPEMMSEYLSFLRLQQAKCTDSNLKLYFAVLLLKTYSSSDAKQLLDVTEYIHWSRFVDEGLLTVRHSYTKIGVLKSGLEVHRDSGKLWLEYIESLPVGDQAPSFLEAVAATNVAEKGSVWRSYISHLTALCTAQPIQKCSQDRVDHAYEAALKPGALASSSPVSPTFADELAVLCDYVDWAQLSGGLSKLRKVCNNLVQARPRSPLFLRHCVDTLSEALSDPSVKLSESDRNAAIKDARKLYNLAISAGSSDSDNWLSAIQFEFNVAKDLTTGMQLHWRATKEVGDYATFARKFEQLKSGESVSESEEEENAKDGEDHDSEDEQEGSEDEMDEGEMGAEITLDDEVGRDDMDEDSD
ncbi:hypothetical protein BJ742DRAFT_171015 [Cladochytrium replicatum]|nr:hypothetical protein BJ742DRAFT_171015 [Cladochytrium replicatum]